jgi:hypothetical protein
VQHSFSMAFTERRFARRAEAARAISSAR